MKTSAIPPSIASDAKANRSVSDSPKKRIPPNAVITGTLSWIVAALVALSDGNTEYQSAYPKPEAMAPEAPASEKASFAFDWSG